VKDIGRVHGIKVEYSHQYAAYVLQLATVQLP